MIQTGNSLVYLGNWIDTELDSSISNELSWSNPSHPPGFTLGPALGFGPDLGLRELGKRGECTTGE